MKSAYSWFLWIAAGVLVLFWLVSFGKGLPAIYPSYFDDEGILATLGFFSEWTNPEMASKYPVFTYLLYAPVICLVFVSGMVMSEGFSISSQYPFGFTNPEMVFSVALFGMRLVNLLLVVGCGIYVKRSIKKFQLKVLFPELLLGVLFTPIVLYYGYTTNRDFLVFILSFLIAFELLLLFEGKPKILPLMLFSIAGVLTKDFMAVYGFIAVLIGLSVILRRESLGSVGKEIVLAIGVLVICLLAYHPNRLLIHVNHWLLDGDGVEPYRQFPTGTLLEKMVFLGKISPVFFKMWPVLIPILIGIYWNPPKKPWYFLSLFLILPLVHVVGIIVPIGFSYPRFYLPVYACWTVAAFYLYVGKAPTGFPVIKRVLIAHISLVILLGVGYMAWDYLNFPKRRIEKDLLSEAYANKSIVFNGGVQNVPSANLYTNDQFFMEKNLSEKIKYGDFNWIAMDSLASESSWLLLTDVQNEAAEAHILKEWEQQDLDFPLWPLCYMAHHSYYHYYLIQP